MLVYILAPRVLKRTTLIKSLKPGKSQNMTFSKIFSNRMSEYYITKSYQANWIKFRLQLLTSELHSC